jgi:prepilin-type processing-associated H-X9-DG protein/prepilin-type N-terminal cleavage/methylation domain-containing protein
MGNPLAGWSEGMIAGDVGWPPTRSVRSFTLIELLVVIAIIALLAALLLPSLKAARDRAEAVACAANLHQVALAFRLYADDHDGYYPPPQVAPAGLRYWDLLLPYSDALSVSKRSVWHCPADDRPLNSGSYGQNVNAQKSLSGTPLAPDADYLPYRPDGLKRPTSVIHVGDSGTPFQQPRIWSAVGDVAYRHSNRANLLFFDGHTGAADFDQLSTPNFYWFVDSVGP